MADKYLLSELKAKGSCVSFKAHKNLQRGVLLEIEEKADSVLGTGDFELYKVKDATADTKLGNLLVHNSVPKMYDERLTERDFELKKDEVGRGRHPQSHYKILVHKSVVEGTVAANDLLKLGTSGTFAKDDAGDNVIAVVEEALTWKGQESLIIRFL